MTIEDVIKRLTRKEDKLRSKGWNNEIIAKGLALYSQSLFSDFYKTASEEEAKQLQEIVKELGLLKENQ